MVVNIARFCRRGFVLRAFVTARFCLRGFALCAFVTAPQNSVIIRELYITLHYITSFQTPITPTVTNGASTKSFKFSECELKKVSFQKFFEGISVCEFLKIGRKRIPCLRSRE